MPTPPLSGDPVVDAVLRTSFALRAAVNVELATCGLSLWTFKALRALDALGPSRSVDLSEHLVIAPRTVTGAVDALEAEGLVERGPHPTDRRAHLIVLTDAGRERLVEALGVQKVMLDRIGATLDPAEREQVLSLLVRLEDTVNEVAAAE